MTQRLGRKEYTCARCGEIIKKGERHEVVEWKVGTHYNKPRRYHNECFELETQEASDRTQARWLEQRANGEDPFKWCR